VFSLSRDEEERTQVIELRWKHGQVERYRTVLNDSVTDVKQEVGGNPFTRVPIPFEPIELKQTLNTA